MWVSFIIWIFTAIEGREMKTVILTLSATTLVIPQVVLR